MYDDKTPLGISLPHPANTLEEDIVRLRQALAQIDTALAARQLTSERGAANGYAPLVGGFVPSIHLPSFVDDVIEVANFSALPAVGEAGKIYVTLAAINVAGTNYPANRQYRWGGSTYVEVSSSPGTTDNVVEGIINKYFSVARAQAAMTELLATKAEAEAGIAPDKFMSPVRVAEAISKRAIGTGDVILSARVLSPPDWLPADGSVFSRASYPALAAELGSIPNENCGASGYVSAGSFSTNATNLGRGKVATNGAGVWLCIGTATYNIQRSTDLSSWSGRTVHNATGVDLSALAYGNGRFVASTGSGATNKFYVSTDDGLTWVGNVGSGLTTPNTIFWMEFLPSAGLFVAQYFTGTTVKFATSPDGVTWTARSLVGAPFDNSVVTAVYVASDGYLYVGHGSGYIARTNTGTAWTVVKSTPDSKAVRAFCEIGPYLIAVGDSGYCYRSAGGATWVSFTSPFSALTNIMHAAAANGLAVISASGAANNSWATYDGVNWAAVNVAIGLSPYLRRAQSVGGQLVYISDDNSSTVYLTRHQGFSYNTATQFLTPWKNFSNSTVNGLSAYIKS